MTILMLLAANINIPPWRDNPALNDVISGFPLCKSVRGDQFRRRKTNMGRTLESMDIHSPSLQKQQTTSKTVHSLNELFEEKIILEGTLAQLNQILENHGVGMRQLDGTSKGLQ